MQGEEATGGAAAVVVEVRQYVCFPGMRGRMRRRFEDVNRVIFARLHMKLLWVVDDASDDASLWFALEFRDEAERVASWTAYHSQPEYLAGRVEQEKIISRIVRHLFPKEESSEGSGRPENAR